MNLLWRDANGFERAGGRGQLLGEQVEDGLRVKLTVGQQGEAGLIEDAVTGGFRALAGGVFGRNRQIRGREFQRIGREVGLSGRDRGAVGGGLSAGAGRGGIVALEIIGRNAGVDIHKSDRGKAVVLFGCGGGGQAGQGRAGFREGGLVVSEDFLIDLLAMHGDFPRGDDAEFHDVAIEPDYFYDDAITNNDALAGFA
jgi:hypothetical protein